MWRDDVNDGHVAAIAELVLDGAPRDCPTLELTGIVREGTCRVIADRLEGVLLAWHRKCAAHGDLEGRAPGRRCR